MANGKFNLYKGRPDLPYIEPHYIAAGSSTNDTDQIYAIDTLGEAVTFGAGMLKINDDGTTSASEWAGSTFTGVLYGRWTNVAVTVAPIAAYYVNETVTSN